MADAMSRMPTLVTEEDAYSAWELWHANCGPGAIAGILGLTLDALRPHMGDFERKGYTNPTLVYAALDSLGVEWRKLGRAWPDYGLVRVVWEGPWTEPGVPARAWYRQTHWIGTSLIRGARGIFDINCINNGTGWVSLPDWERVVVPWLTDEIKRATGAWHVVNGIEVLSRAQHTTEVTT